MSVLSTALFLLCLSTQAVAQHHHEEAALRSDRVRVSGLVKQSFTISKSRDNGLEIYSADSAKPLNEGAFQGFRLKEIIQKAGVEMPEHKDQGRFLVVVTAVDGYVATFAYNEIMLAAAGDHAYLIWNEDGYELQKDGPFALVCYSDSKRGPRRVKWVNSIEIRKI